MPPRQSRKTQTSSPPQIDVTMDADDHVIEGDLQLEPAKTIRKESKRKLGRAATVKSGATALRATHRIVAKALDEPQIEISEHEAEALASASIDLAQAYGWDMTAHPKVAATIEWLAVAGEIEGPRLILVFSKPPKRRTTQQAETEPPPLILPDVA